jgi:hypothetical protein
MDKSMGCSGAPYHQEAAYDINRGAEKISQQPIATHDFNRGYRNLPKSTPPATTSVVYKTKKSIQVIGE